MHTWQVAAPSSHLCCFSSLSPTRTHTQAQSERRKHFPALLAHPGDLAALWRPSPMSPKIRKEKRWVGPVSTDAVNSIGSPPSI